MLLTNTAYEQRRRQPIAGSATAAGPGVGPSSATRPEPGSDRCIPSAWTPCSS